MKDYVIVANGTFLVKEIIQETIKNKTVIALDGAANKLARLGIMPEVVLGDFDSVTKTTGSFWGIKQTFGEMSLAAKPYAGNHRTTIVPALDQDHTDLVKAIRYCDTQGATSITIICATGGRLDHHEATMMTLRSEYKKSRPIFLHTEQQTLRYAKDETVTIQGEPGDKCGIIATHTGTITSKGLEYECKGHTESTSNALTGNQAMITVKGGGLMIMPPLLAAQREYMKKNEVEQLELQLRDAKQTIEKQLIKQCFFANDSKDDFVPEKISTLIASLI